MTVAEYGAERYFSRGTYATVGPSSGRMWRVHDTQSSTEAASKFVERGLIIWLPPQLLDGWPLDVEGSASCLLSEEYIIFIYDRKKRWASQAMLNGIHDPNSLNKHLKSACNIIGT